MTSFAIIQTGGKQYKVSAGDKIRVEKLNTEAGATFTFNQVLLRAEGDKIEIGTPNIEGATVTGKVLQQGRDKKKIVFKFHSKTRYHKKKGHRQAFTEVEIIKV